MSPAAGNDLFNDRGTAEDYLRSLGRENGPILPLAEAALALGARRSSPQSDLSFYQSHLHSLARDVTMEGAGQAIEGRIAALNRVLFGRHGYEGDAATYDDLQNADLIRVIDRRKGLPVALGILYIHAARAQGWTMVGLGFPGHFLVQMEAGGSRAILDPFHAGRRCAIPELRDMLTDVMADNAKLTPRHYGRVTDREILLRLQNNLKLRLIEAQRREEAIDVIEGMMLFAPDRPALLREAGLLRAELGHLRAAIAAFERLARDAETALDRQDATALLRQMKSRLQ